MKLKPIEQQTVVIMGATSGIGRLAALRFAKGGANVVVSGRSLPALEQLANEIRQDGGSSLPVEADASEIDQVVQVADRAVGEYGRIDTWVSLAAVSLYATFAETRPEEFKRVIDVNLMGQVYGAMAALPHLKREGRGALIHISSVEARRALPLQTAYAASKHALRGFLDSLRMEIEQEELPIAVTNVMPASINTPLFDKALTRLGVKPRPVPPVYKPEVVVEAILYAAEHPVREIYAGGAGKGLGLLQRISPRLAERMLAPAAFRLQRTDQPKADSAPHNLFEHIEGYDTVSGSFSEEATSFSPYTWLQTHPAAKVGMAALALAGGAVLSGRALQSRRKKKSWPLRLLRGMRR